MAATPPVCAFGWPAPHFTLPDTEGRVWTYDRVAGRNGALIAFICNHCPYVKAIIDRLVRDARVLEGMGFGVAAIMSNDWDAYPDDAPDRMAAFAATHDFSFPYLIDRSQDTARAYGAVCTPDFFGFNARAELQYRGRLDAAGRGPSAPDAPRELVEAMRRVAETGRGPEEQTASIGCSIKWRAA